jgi:hypothetical protein
MTDQGLYHGNKDICEFLVFRQRQFSQLWVGSKFGKAANKWQQLQSANARSKRKISRHVVVSAGNSSQRRIVLLFAYSDP